MRDETVFYEDQVNERSDTAEYSPFQMDEGLADRFEAIHRRTELKPEENLMLAILEDAVACFQKNLLAKSNKGKAVFEETQDWILEDNEEWLFSFRTICETFGIDPAWLRQGLMEWKRRELENRGYREAA